MTAQEIESRGEYIDDSFITAAVKARLIEKGIFMPLQITVATYDGMVHLSGTVDLQSSVQRATEIAHTVEGVKSVIKSLEVANFHLNFCR